MARRFVTYNTEDQAAGLVNVDERGVLMPIAPVIFTMSETGVTCNKTYEETLELLKNGAVCQIYSSRNTLDVAPVSAGIRCFYWMEDSENNLTMWFHMPSGTSGSFVEGQLVYYSKTGDIDFGS